MCKLNNIIGLLVLEGKSSETLKRKNVIRKFRNSKENIKMFFSSKIKRFKRKEHRWGDQTTDISLNNSYLLGPREGCEVLWWVYLFACLSVCLSARVTQKPRSPTSPIFCTRCLWPLLGPPMTALRYVTYFRFTDVVTFSYRGIMGPMGNGRGIKHGIVFTRVRQTMSTVGRQTTAAFGWVRENAAPGWGAKSAML